MELNILVLPGDGIGPEITAEAVKVLEAVCAARGHALALGTGLIGGASLEATGEPVSAATLAAAQAADAVLLGAVGLPKFDGLPPAKRAERGLLDLRKAMGVFANLRPVKAHPALHGASPLKEERVAGTDLLILRELTGGLYFGQPRALEGTGTARRAFNTLPYAYDEIARVAVLAFELARGRRRKVTSVDKANVLETSQLWRQVVTEIAAGYPDVALDHLYVDNASMQLVLNPRSFDVLLTENLFGDILSDEAAVLAGSIGLLPSGSLGARRPDGTVPGLYEPIHGSAPDLAGKGVANPLGTIGSVAAMLDWSFGLKAEAAAVEEAVAHVLEHGPCTPDLPGGKGTTAAVGDAVRTRILKTMGA
ncbi:MAG TPA: 3-isopropylmalate dehydrogenase [Holophaga sp.]|nr:3-isopropylmalate dehydrogenase [Holophaga sp.]